MEERESRGKTAASQRPDFRSGLSQSVGSASVSGNEHCSKSSLDGGNPVDVGTPSTIVAIFDNSLFFDESLDRWHYILRYVQLDMIKRKLCDFLAGRSQRAR